jgi:hypothetical protein
MGQSASISPPLRRGSGGVLRQRTSSVRNPSVQRSNLTQFVISLLEFNYPARVCNIEECFP